MKRIGRDRFIRNVLYAAGNSGDAALIEPVRRLLDDPDPVVRDAAEWALARLEPRLPVAQRWGGGPAAQPGVEGSETADAA